MKQNWKDQLTQLSDSKLAALFTTVRREMQMRQQSRLARQEEQFLRSTITTAEVSYLEHLYSLPDTRENLNAPQ